MDFLAVALVVCTVLYLVDKNQAWQKFWRLLKWSAVLVLGVVFLGGSSWYLWNRHQAKSAVTLDMSTAQPIQSGVKFDMSKAQPIDFSKYDVDYDAPAAQYGGKVQLPAGYEDAKPVTITPDPPRHAAHGDIFDHVAAIDCAKKVRKRTNAYQDMTDEDLGRRVLAKFPGCNIPPLLKGYTLDLSKN
jgi:hypothetical protein